MGEYVDELRTSTTTRICSPPTRVFFVPTAAIPGLRQSLQSRTSDISAHSPAYRCPANYHPAGPRFDRGSLGWQRRQGHYRNAIAKGAKIQISNREQMVE